MRQDTTWSKEEKIDLLLPVVLVVVACAGIFYTSPALFQRGTSQYWISSVFAELIFLNLTHNAFTFMMLTSLPELRPWIEEKGGGSATRFYVSLGIKATVLAALFWLAVAKLSPALTDLLIFVSVMFPFHHALAQSHGLSLLYNRRAVDGVTGTKDRRRRLESMERILIFALIGVMIIPVLLWRLPKWFDWLPSAFLTFFESFGTTSMLVIANSVVGATLLTMFFYPSSIRLRKVVHAVRYLLWSLSFVSPFATWSTKVVHGIEYFFVFRKMSSNSSAVEFKKINLFLICCVVVIGVPRVLIESGFEFNSGKGLDVMKVAMAISLSISFLHYYLDRQLFLMRRPMNRTTVGRLID